MSGTSDGPRSSSTPTGARRDRGGRIDRFLALLNHEGVRYAVLGRARAHPEPFDGDVDVVVDRSARSRMHGIVAGFCEATGGLLVNRIRHAPESTLYVCAWLAPEADGPPDVLEIDVHGDLWHARRRLCTAQELLAGRVSRPGDGTVGEPFHAVAPAAGFTLGLLKALERKRLDAVAADRLARLWEEDPAGTRVRAGAWWSPDQVRTIEAAVRSGDWSTVRGGGSALLGRARRRTRPAWRSPLAHASWLAERIRYPTGFVVVFLGPDGCGKSTMIRRLMGTATALFPDTAYFHFKPNLVGPPPAAPGGPAPAVDHPTGMADGWSVKATLRIAYYVGDYWIGYLLKILPLRVRTRLIVFDRFFHDLAIDPIRLRHRTLMRWAARLRPLVFRPDLVLVMDAPAERLHERKSEVPPIAETERQRRAYVTLAGTLPRARRVDADAPPGAVFARIQRLLHEEMARRVRRAWPFPATDDRSRPAA